MSYRPTGIWTELNERWHFYEMRQFQREQDWGSDLGSTRRSRWRNLRWKRGFYERLQTTRNYFKTISIRCHCLLWAAHMSVGTCPGSVGTLSRKHCLSLIGSCLLNWRCSYKYTKHKIFNFNQATDVTWCCRVISESLQKWFVENILETSLHLYWHWFCYFTLIFVISSN